MNINAGEVTATRIVRTAGLPTFEGGHAVFAVRGQRFESRQLTGRELAGLSEALLDHRDDLRGLTVTVEVDMCSEPTAMVVSLGDFHRWVMFVNAVQEAAYRS